MSFRLVGVELLERWYEAEPDADRHALMNEWLADLLDAPWSRSCCSWSPTASESSQRSSSSKPRLSYFHENADTPTLGAVAPWPRRCGRGAADLQLCGDRGRHLEDIATQAETEAVRTWQCRHGASARCWWDRQMFPPSTEEADEDDGAHEECELGWVAGEDGTCSGELLVEDV